MAKLKKYEELGLDSLLQERRGGRNHAYMTVEEESINWDLVGLLKEYVLISIVITYVNSLIVTDLTGESFFLIVGGYNTEWMTVFLEEFLQAYPKDSILLVIDHAIWYKLSILIIPNNIGFSFIPLYTPEMNPIEQVWKEIRKCGFKNKAFQTLEDVIDKLQDVIQGLEREIINSIINRRWAIMLFKNR